MNLDTICEGMVIKNYRQLCKILDIEEKTGQSKQYQVKDLQRYFQFSRSGQSIIVDKIYETPTEKISRSNQNRKNKYKDLTGLFFNRLKVISLYERRRNNSGGTHLHWLCLCDCGKKRIVSGGSLKQGSVKSCGQCSNEKFLIGEIVNIIPTQRNMATEKKGDGTRAAFNLLYAVYKNGAKKRDYSFELNKIQFATLTKQDCFYCGEEPKQVTKHRNGNYIYNGIDRIDNDQGYFEGNVVPCCGKCNKAKSVETQTNFIEWIKRVYEHLMGER
jgi:hypothetical protein